MSGASESNLIKILYAMRSVKGRVRSTNDGRAEEETSQDPRASSQAAGDQSGKQRGSWETWDADSSGLLCLLSAPRPKTFALAVAEKRSRTAKGWGTMICESQLCQPAFPSADTTACLDFIVRADVPAELR